MAERQVDLETERLKARIRALRAMTTARGCSEAEALFAAEKARELLARFNLAEELVERPAFLRVDNRLAKAAKRTPWVWLWGTIGAQCHCATYYHGDSLVYFGFEPDALVADYLHDVAVRYVETVRRDFLRSAEYRKRRTRRTKNLAVAAFLEGCIRALVWRLKEALRGAEKPDREEKRRLIDAELERIEPRLGTYRTGRHRSLRNHSAFGDGVSAGRNANFHAGVKAGPAPGQVKATLRLQGPQS